MFYSDSVFPPEDPRVYLHSRPVWIPHSVNDIMQRFLNMLHPACMRSPTVIDYFYRAGKKTGTHQGLLLIEVICVISATSFGWGGVDTGNWCKAWKQMNTGNKCEPCWQNESQSGIFFQNWLFYYFKSSILKASKVNIVCWNLASIELVLFTSVPVYWSGVTSQRIVVVNLQRENPQESQWCQTLQYMKGFPSTMAAAVIEQNIISENKHGFKAWLSLVTGIFIDSFYANFNYSKSHYFYLFCSLSSFQPILQQIFQEQVSSIWT